MRMYLIARLRRQIVAAAPIEPRGVVELDVVAEVAGDQIVVAGAHADLAVADDRVA